VIYGDPEDKRQYCFAIDKLAESIAEQSLAFSSLASTRIINPKTGRYFSEKFIKEFLQKYGLYQRPALETAKKEIEKEEAKKEAFLIPNLYDIVKGHVDLLVSPHRQEEIKEKGAKYIIGDIVKIPDDNREYTVIDISFEGDEIIYTIRYEKDVIIIPRKEYKLMVASFENDDPYVINEEEVQVRDGKFYLGNKQIISSSDKNYTPGTIVIKISEKELLEGKEAEEEKLPDYKKVKSMLAELAGKEEKSRAKMGFATKEGSASTSSSSKSSSEGEESESVSSVSSEKTAEKQAEPVEKKEEASPVESSGTKCEKCGKPCSDAIKSVIMEESGPKVVYFCDLKEMEKFHWPSIRKSRRRRGRKRSSK
jgi:hypothetical protein